MSSMDSTVYRYIGTEVTGDAAVLSSVSPTLRWLLFSSDQFVADEVKLSHSTTTSLLITTATRIESVALVLFSKQRQYFYISFRSVFILAATGPSGGCIHGIQHQK